jgi:hypothetical protein
MGKRKDRFKEAASPQIESEKIIIKTKNEESEEENNKTRSIIFSLLTDNDLTFDYEIRKDGTCIADQSQSGIETAEELEYIKVIERDVSGRLQNFIGGPEPVISSTLKYVIPEDKDFKNEILGVHNFGEWVCLRCGSITFIPFEKGKVVEPFECSNDLCGRKGPFRKLFPENLVKPVWKLPFTPIQTSSVEIYSDVLNFCKTYLVLKDEEYHLVTAWILASWLVDDFSSCPYLCMIAPKSSGKTKVLEVLGELAYRAVSTISITPASLFRAIELWNITLLIDEAEHQIKTDTEAGQALYGCLNGGYKRGSYALRTEGDANNRVPASFEVFGFKAIASTKLFHPTLESRSIVINMTQGIPKKIIIDSGRAAILRSKLLFWRFETLGKLKLAMPESLSGRLIEMFIPLFTVAQILKGTESIKKEISYDGLLGVLNKTMKDMESMRQEEEHQSTEAQIINAITDLEAKCKEGYSDELDYIFMKEVTNHLGWEVTPKGLADMGRILKSLGIKTTRKSRGTIIQIWDADVQKRLRDLEERYLKQGG